LREEKGKNRGEKQQRQKRGNFRSERIYRTPKKRQRKWDFPLPAPCEPAVVGAAADAVGSRGSQKEGRGELGGKNDVGKTITEKKGQTGMKEAPYFIGPQKRKRRPIGKGNQKEKKGGKSNHQGTKYVYHKGRQKDLRETTADERSMCRRVPNRCGSLNQGKKGKRKRVAGFLVLKNSHHGKKSMRGKKKKPGLPPPKVERGRRERRGVQRKNRQMSRKRREGEKRRGGKKGGGPN